MKEVLVPVDFSEESIIALDFGIDLANHLNANMRVIHVKTDSVIIPFFSTNEADDRLNQDVEAWAEQLHRRFIHKYKVSCGVFDYKIREGNIVKEIANQARYGDTTIIVLGSHEDKSITSRWVGSPAYRLVAHAPCPVLVVNKRMQLKHAIKSIALPVDYSIASRKKVPAIAGVAKLFDAKVHVVGLKTSDLDWMNEQMKAFVKQVEKFVVERARVEVKHSQLTGRDFSENLMNYAEENAIDLITTHVHHANNPFVRVFQSFTNDLINKSLKPVLVIPTKD
ncbi:universal stress protein [Carboxylicivirga sediminis]|uniref:Universal stress protein n=1 Tax=Carboxylicivirga sediminis TaxID=2006564 RepID=A0A941IYS7_9BACT|nr:universal stress protein [Carboxylicivirga sediminis]MBR8536908.1 universal stress protein [Carboxylicivirga sediminis]